MSGPDDIEVQFEAAMAEFNGALAAELAPLHTTDRARAMRRAWNMLAFGEDIDDEFSLDLMKTKQAEAADRGIAWIKDHHRGKQDCDNPFVALNEHGGGIHHRDAPHIAWELITHQCLTPGAARDFAAYAWKHCEFPEGNFVVEGWLVIFDWVERLTGARLHDADGLEEDEDDEEAPAGRSEQQEWTEPDGLFPVEPVTLWRGATRNRAVGMAWTADRDRAEWFARRFNDALDDTAYLWETTVAPERIRARFVGRQEAEYVINPVGLRIGGLPEDIRLVVP